MEKKIIITGAGIGGLFASELLGKLGYKVLVFEKKGQNELSYDWHDDVSPTVFKDLNIEIDPSLYFKKSDWSFATPFEETVIKLNGNPENADLSIERRLLSNLLYERAKEFAEFRFHAEVNAPIVSNNKVIGIMVNGKAEYADLVIDSGGVFSNVRSKLPKNFMIQNNPEPYEVFFAYRAFISRLKGIPEPEHNTKVYLRHLGDEGISWCIADHNPELVNVLIGRVKELNKETLNKALQDLRLKNPYLGKEVKRGGITVPIPVRHPLTVMVADGYAAIGDAAFMTIPMIGSGIATSLYAAKILSDTVSNGDFSKENLWNYQIACYKKFGAAHYGVDVLKRWMLSAKTEDITWLFSSSVISDKDMGAASSGKNLKLSIPEIIKKIIIGRSNIPLLLSLNNMLKKSKKAVALANNIPKTYNPLYIERWDKKLSKFF